MLALLAAGEFDYVEQTPQLDYAPILLHDVFSELLTFGVEQLSNMSYETSGSAQLEELQRTIRARTRTTHLSTKMWRAVRVYSSTERARST